MKIFSHLFSEYKKTLSFSLIALTALLGTGCSWFKKDSKNVENVEKASYERGAGILNDEVDDIEEIESIFADEDISDSEPTTIIEEDIIENPFDTSVQIEEKEEAAEVHETEQHIGVVYYGFDEFKLDKNQLRIAKEFAREVKSILGKHSGARVLVKGHACCSAGSHRYNLQISSKRSRNLASIIENEGVDVSRISDIGCGTEELIIATGNREEQAPNRRAEIFVIFE